MDGWNPYDFVGHDPEWNVYRKEKDHVEPRCYCGAVASVRCRKCDTLTCGAYYCVMRHNRKKHGSKSVIQDRH